MYAGGALAPGILDQWLLIAAVFIQVVVGFSSKDLALFYLLAGLLAILSQGLLLQPLVDRIRERGVLVVSCINNMLTSLIFIFIAGYYPRKWVVFVMAPVGMLSTLMLPTILAMTSSSVAEQVMGYAFARRTHWVPNTIIA